eukprot:1837697-Rhodomonas_salina.1
MQIDGQSCKQGCSNKTQRWECVGCLTGAACQNNTIQRRRWEPTRLLSTKGRGTGLAFDRAVAENV